VVLKGLFDPKEAVGDPQFYSDLKPEIGAECEKIGPVQSLHIFENNPEGVVAVKYETHRAASRCIEVMNGRWFAKRQVSAEFYDGHTQYEVRETDAQEKARIEHFGKWLETTQ